MPIQFNTAADRAPSLGRVLVASGALSPDLLRQAEAQCRCSGATLGQALKTSGLVPEKTLETAIAALAGSECAKTSTLAGDARLIDEIGLDTCLAHGILPLQRLGRVLVLATGRPDEFSGRRRALEPRVGPVRMIAASERTIRDRLVALRSDHLRARAETSLPLPQSCRQLDPGRIAFVAGTAILGVGALGIFAPALLFMALVGWALLTLVLWTGLKVAAALALLRPRRPTIGLPMSAHHPSISILVPLFGESEIAGRLVRRLSRLDYPRDRLEVCLIVEQDDLVTQAALARAELPGWFRTISVPRGTVQTKPRALNYATGFCRGEIIGIYDAEDAPDPAQLRRVADHFRNCPPEVACLQGALDYYNAQKNWLSRCFTVEYASWFRVILPGIARLGLAVPLGGTTLFLRREALEKVGGWDAHNVTEDADLGIRLARHGYRTELIDTVTGEEANCRPLPWIRQRSRWIKGFAMTWLVHMSEPCRLWRELGPKRFLGFQILFAGSVSQALLAPLLWSFWAIPFGIWHPAQAYLDAAALITLAGIFLASEAITVAVGLLGSWKAGHRFLLPWVPSLHLYYPLASLASYKALWEIVMCPFYWDKTEHGIADEG
ncbi:MAG: glycosyltransferase [Rhodobacteraceae bacterium]|nr:glycosyltransferase [Paracoccaceae bacterium]